MEVLFPMLEKKKIFTLKAKMTPKNVCIILKYTWCLFQSTLDNAFQNHLLFANESYEIKPQSVHIYLFNIMETYFFSETIYQEHIYMF